GRLGEMLLENKIKQMSVQDQDKYRMAMLPILQETAGAREVSAGAQQTTALSNAGNKLGAIARISAALGWNDVGDAANEMLQKNLTPQIPPQPKGNTPPAGLPSGNGKTLDKVTAKTFLDAAGGDPNKARLLARQNN